MISALTVDRGGVHLELYVGPMSTVILVRNVRVVIQGYPEQLLSLLSDCINDGKSGTAVVTQIDQSEVGFALNLTDEDDIFLLTILHYQAGTIKLSIRVEELKRLYQMLHDFWVC